MWQEWEKLGVWLAIPDSERDRIQRQSCTDEEATVSVTLWWMKTHPSPSWRCILWALDQMFEELGLRVVDEIHHYAEPLTGKTSVLQSHTMHSVDTTPCTMLYAMVYNQEPITRRSIQWHWYDKAACP